MRIARLDRRHPNGRELGGVGGDRRGRRGNADVEAVDLRGDLGKLGRRQFVAVGQHHGAEHRVLELADVARPVVGGEQRQRLGGNAADALALLGAEAGEKAPGEIGHVAGAGAQRRNRDREDVEPVEQVLAEAARLHEFDQVLVGRRDQADVDLDRAARADRIDLALLQRAQELDLGVERQFADLVEKQRAAVRLGELADVLLGRAGEGALLVAEQDRTRPASRAARRN